MEPAASHVANPAQARANVCEEKLTDAFGKLLSSGARSPRKYAPGPPHGRGGGARCAVVVVERPRFGAWCRICQPSLGDALEGVSPLNQFCQLPPGTKAT